MEAVINAVNTVGIMGKGIALMFKERFPDNFKAYKEACDNGQIRIGKMFVSENRDLFAPKWIVNFPTKTHWRANTRLEWIEEGLEDLVRVISDKNIRSIAVPPLGCGNGGLNWSDVKPLMVTALEQVESLEEAIVYEPIAECQNNKKLNGADNLTPVRALVAEMVRRYCMLGMDCSSLEVQKLAWFIERGVKRSRVNASIDFEFVADQYGPYSRKLEKLLDSLDNSYLQSEKRLSAAGPFDSIWFNGDMKEELGTYFSSGEGKTYASVLEWTSSTIDGFESPFGMELLATVDWLLKENGVEPTVEQILNGLQQWAGCKIASERKLRTFDQRSISIALEQLGRANSWPT